MCRWTQARSVHLEPVCLRHGTQVDRQVRGVGHKRVLHELGQKKVTTAQARKGHLEPVGLRHGTQADRQVGNGCHKRVLHELGEKKVTTAQARKGHLEPVGLRHGTQVDGQVRGVGHKGAIRPKQGAREVEALLDVDTDAGALQCAPHLLCYAHEPAEKKCLRFSAIITGAC